MSATLSLLLNLICAIISIYVNYTYYATCHLLIFYNVSI